MRFIFYLLPPESTAVFPKKPDYEKDNLLILVSKPVMNDRRFLFWVRRHLFIFVQISHTVTFRIYISGKDECQLCVGLNMILYTLGLTLFINLSYILKTGYEIE